MNPLVGPASRLHVTAARRISKINKKWVNASILLRNLSTSVREYYVDVLLTEKNNSLEKKTYIIFFTITHDIAI